MSESDHNNSENIGHENIGHENIGHENIGHEGRIIAGPSLNLGVEVVNGERAKFWSMSYRDQEPGTAVVCCTLTEPGETFLRVLLRWVPNLNEWCRDGDTENEFLYGDDGDTFTEITREQARDLLPTVKPLDMEKAASVRMMNRFRMCWPEDRRTNDQLGINDVEPNVHQDENKSRFVVEDGKTFLIQNGLKEELQSLF